MPSPIPKPASQRQRRNRTSTAAHLEGAPPTKVSLPEGRWSSIKCQECALPKWSHTRAKFEDAEVEPHDYNPRPIPWKPQTVSWWDTIWDSPMVGEWVEADVPQLLALAVLVDEFWTFGDSKIHAEWRQASREYGLSPLSRRMLQWEVHKVESVKKPPQAQPSSRRGHRAFSVLSGKSA